jgi:hypothetical protein
VPEFPFVVCAEPWKGGGGGRGYCHTAVKEEESAEDEREDEG